MLSQTEMKNCAVDGKHSQTGVCALSDAKAKI